MRYIINDRKYHFRSAFHTETGVYVRTGILDNDSSIDGTSCEIVNEKTGCFSISDGYDFKLINGVINRDKELAKVDGN